MATPDPGPSEFTRMADEDLLVVVARGESDAFAVIYDRHARVAYSLAYRLLGDRQIAEDLVQDTFLAVWRGAAKYSPSRGSVRNWLLSILHNRGVDRLRTSAAMNRRQEALEQIEMGRPTAPDAASQAISSAMGVTVREGLGELPEEQRQVLKLAYYGGFTQQEISQALALPLGTVKSRMRLGLERLRRGLGEEARA